MSLRIIVLALVAGLAFIACGPSSGQINTARTARYQTTASAAFQAGVAALAKNDYKVAAADPVAGKARTAERWYELDGTYISTNSDGELVKKDGMVVLTLELSVVADGTTFRIEVTPVAAQFRNGYSALVPLKDNDAAMSSWITGKVDNLYLSVYEALKQDAIAPGT